MILEEFNKLKELKEFELAGLSIIPFSKSDWLEVKFLIKSKEFKKYLLEKLKGDEI